MSNKALKKVGLFFQYFFQSIFTYSYNQERYPDTFLSSSPKVTKTNLLPFPRVIYVFWTGDNKMSENRLEGVNSLIEKSGVEVKVITPQNLNSYILKDYPLHPAYDYLSLVHKSDYLRCYFMFHYGGGYADVKKYAKSWVPAFDQLQNSNKWLVGYREIKSKALAQVGGQIGTDMKRHFLFIIGNCAYICRPHSPLTQDWYQELHKRMDKYQPALTQNPGNILGDNEGYPIPWTNILGDIFHPLCLKYMDKLYFSDRIKPIFTNYR